MKHNKLNKLCLAIAATGLVAGYTTAASAFTITGGDNTKVDIYGYVKADVRYDFGQNLNPGPDYSSPAADFPQIKPTGADGTNGHLNFTSQQTRLGFNFTQGTDMGDVKAKLEGDWASGGSKYAFRIRHAYVEWQGFLVGQTWSNFTSWNDWADTLDWDGQAGHAGGFRHGQVRYTMNTGAGEFAVALEQPSSSGITGATNTKDQIPDLTARFEGKAGPLSYGVGLMGRKFKYDDGAGSNSSANGWGAMATASFAVASGTNLMAGVVHGNGLGDYLYLGFAPGYVDGSGKIKALSQTGATLGVSQAVTADSLLSLSYGYAKTDTPSGYTGIDKKQNAFVTYEITPVKHLTYGVEYAYYKVDAANGGGSDNGSRLQFSAKYSF